MSRRTDELGVVPGSRLDTLLKQLPRRVRRTFLAALTGADTPRRARLERRARRMMARLGIVALLLLSLIACTDRVEGQIVPDDPGSYPYFYYVEGPNGEHCLVAQFGAGYSGTGGMHCDTVNWPAE